MSGFDLVSLSRFHDDPAVLWEVVGDLVDPRALAWRSAGACRGRPQAWWFPQRGQDTKRAKEVCAGCVVREQCGAYALTHSDERGIWGGLSERERRRLRSARHAEAA